jgi:hypothetical protein
VPGVYIVANTSMVKTQTRIRWTKETVRAEQRPLRYEARITPQGLGRLEAATLGLKPVQQVEFLPGDQHQIL